jgi:hypothetical protein
MNRLFSIIAVAFVAITSVQAACGGGGYRVNKDKDPRYDEKNVVRSNVNLSETKRDQPSSVTVVRADQIPMSSAQNVAYRNEARSWEKAHVDAARSRMDLTSNQDSVLEKVSIEFRRKGDDLKQSYDEAKKKLDNCKGDCPDEKKKLADAGAALDKLDQDYQRRISRFLSSGQLETFQNTAASANFK